MLLQTFSAGHCKALIQYNTKNFVSMKKFHLKKCRVNGNRELWLAISHSRKVKEVINNNDIFWLVKRKGLLRLGVFSQKIVLQYLHHQ